MHEINGSIQSHSSSTARVKHNFSRQHLKAAKLFADLAAQIEKRENLSEGERSEHRAYISGAVVFAAAFLETSINELFLDCIDKNSNSLGSLSKRQVALLAELWEHVEQRSLLDKYQEALATCGSPSFEKGKDPYQGTEGLIRIRNALIHYKPEWDNELEEHKKLKSRLNGRFPLNRHGEGLWFPHLCLGAGCAAWSTDQVEGFMKEFCQRLGIPSRFP